MTDEPIAHTKDGRPVYDNTPTVVVGLVTPDGKRLLVVRRKNEPGAGLMALPGGYHMRGEIWQEALAREVREETGVVVEVGLSGSPSDTVAQYGEVFTDEYGNNLIFGVAVTRDPVDLSAADGEVASAWYTNELGDVTDWAFPMHYHTAKRFLAEFCSDEV